MRCANTNRELCSWMLGVVQRSALVLEVPEEAKAPNSITTHYGVKDLAGVAKGPNSKTNHQRVNGYSLDGEERVGLQTPQLVSSHGKKDEESQAGVMLHGSRERWGFIRCPNKRRQCVLCIDRTM